MVIRVRYTPLLVSLLIFVLVVPILHDRPLLKFLVPILIVILLLSGFYAVIRDHLYTLCALVLLLASLVAHAASFMMTDIYMFALAQFLGCSFLILMTVVFLIRLFQEHNVTCDTIAGSVCVYLLIGFVWGYFYILTALFSPESFLIAGEFMKPIPLEQIRIGGFPEFTYFSFVTLSTLGYGDITPVSPFVRSLATLEALVGPLYLTVLVARLVGLHIIAAKRSGYAKNRLGEINERADGNQICGV
jgi:Ion channel